MTFKYLAQKIQLDPIGGTDLGPFGNYGIDLGSQGEQGAVTALTGITKVISAIIGIMTVAAAVWFIFQFLVGGLNWITSAGDKAKLEDARNRITHAFIGLIIVIAGWAILALAGQFFGFDILINPGDLIPKLNVGQP